MRFQVEASGHAAIVDLAISGGDFTGEIDSGDHGKGVIKSGHISGGALSGVVEFGGHAANFTAVISGQRISGQIVAKRFGITFLSEHFTGTQVEA